MTRPLGIYLEHRHQKRAKAGKHNFINKMMRAAERAGFSVSFHPNSIEHRLAATGHALTHMKPPASDNGLVFRKVYHAPFWQIEQTHERWHWQVARKAFDPESVPRDKVRGFRRFWRRKLFSPLLETVSDEGFIYIPLQGRLLDHRSFQSCSPMEMIARTREACPDRQIECALHPNETYSPEELKAIEGVCQADPRMNLRMGGMSELLPGCSAIVTQNSSVAFNGYFLDKPVLFFAGIDFHHIGLKHDEPEAFERLFEHRPDTEAYLWWFWQMNCINAGHDDAEDKILQRFAEYGWCKNAKDAP